ncbi:MAG: hypothetical protein EBR88_08645, partial [Betaproteobacteria bacterium]|nr:hypothetical protein [Betaproteobacteria bacterium]
MPYFTPPGYSAASGGGPAKSRRKEFIPEEDFNDELSQLMQTGGSAIEFIGKVLDTPGAIARGVLAGDPTSGFSWDSDRRVTGEELLDSYGLTDENTNPYAKTALGFATEIVTDPLAWISLPGQALTKAGKVAKNIQGAGGRSLLDLAPIAAQRRIGDAAAASTMAGRYTDNAFKALAQEGIERTDDMYKLRPLMGPRLSRATTSLDEVVKASDDPIRALDDITKYLNKAGVNYDDIKHEKLGGALGFGFMSPWVTVTPPGSLPALDALDAAGQAIRWSSPVRYGSSFF